jgi:hypothetical protein
VLVPHRANRKNQTWYLVNTLPENADESTYSAEASLRDARKSMGSASKLMSSMDLSDEGVEEKMDDLVNQEAERLINQVTDLVDKAYDILPAEMILAEVEQLIGQEKFLEQVVSSDLFERFARKLDYFYDVGSSCSQPQDGWLEVYSAEGGKQTIKGIIDAEDPSVLHYAVRTEIPTSISNVMAVANEVQFMQQWNSLVAKEPEIVGRRTAHYLVLNYQISAVGGMYKVDVLNEIRRFSDVEGGYLVEYVTSVPKDHPSYREPQKGFKRMQTLIKNVMLACGPDYTVLLQIGKLKLPFSATKWLAKTLGGVAGKFIIGGLVTNALKAGTPGNPWETAIREDKQGLYHRLNECIQSRESEKRDPAKSSNGKVPDVNLARFFDTRRFARESSRKVRLQARRSRRTQQGLGNSKSCLNLVTGKG